MVPPSTDTVDPPAPRERASWLLAVLLPACAGPTSGTFEPEAERPKASTVQAQDPCSALPACLERAQAVAERSARAAEDVVSGCLACPNEAAYRFWADLLKGRGDLDGAREVLLEGRQAFPRSTPMLLALARVERDLGRPHAAIAHLASARRLAPHDPLLESEYRRLVLRHGHPEARAEAELEGLLRLAAGRWALDDLDGALQALARAERQVADVPRLVAIVHHRRALVRLGVGDARAAEADAAAGLAQGTEAEPLPMDTEVALQITRGEALLALGRYADARGANRQALDRDPTDPIAWANLAFAHLHLGEEDEATRALQRAVQAGLARHLTWEQLQGAAPDPAWLMRADLRPALEAAWPNAAQ